MENAVFWEKMYAANIGRMIGLCHRYVNDLPLAEDLAHEAFLKAMERADTFRATGNFEAWLMRITVNHTIQHLRKSIDMVPVVEEETPDVATEETSIWEMDFTQEELLEAVQQLPVRERTVFNLYAIGNYDGGLSLCGNVFLIENVKVTVVDMVVHDAQIVHVEIVQPIVLVYVVKGNHGSDVEVIQ